MFKWTTFFCLIALKPVFVFLFFLAKTNLVYCLLQEVVEFASSAGLQNFSHQEGVSVSLCYF